LWEARAGDIHAMTTKYEASDVVLYAVGFLLYQAVVFDTGPSSGQWACRMVLPFVICYN